MLNIIWQYNDTVSKLLEVSLMGEIVLGQFAHYGMSIVKLITSGRYNSSVQLEVLADNNDDIDNEDLWLK